MCPASRAKRREAVRLRNLRSPRYVGVEHRKTREPELAASDHHDAFSIGSLALFSAAYQRKILEITQANTQAAFDYAARLSTCRSTEQFVALTQDYTRRQIEQFERQSRELIELAQDGKATVKAPPVQPE